MADDKAAATTFTSLPLEVRHAIFEHAAARNVKSKKLLRYWFEKKEAKDLVAQLVAANPNGPAPRVVYDNDDYASESEPIEHDSDEEDEEDGEGDDEDMDSEEDDELAQEADGDEEDEDDMGQDEAEQEAEAADEDADEEAMGDNQHSASAVHTQSLAPTQIQLQSSISAQQVNQAEQDHAYEEEEQEGGLDTNEHNAEDDIDHDGDSAMDGEDDDGEDATAAIAQTQVQAQAPAQAQAQRPLPPPRAPVVRPHHKWRHIPKFMQISHCPPPVELLLTSKQLDEEVKSWFYDVAVLRIEATGSFAHTSFFEEAFSQITEAAFSPMENIRKVEVAFVWDTTWIRADTTGCVEAIFPALLRQRSNFVYQILTQAPDLKEVVIHWHDSAQDNESANLRMDIIEPFLNLPATVKTAEHYIDANAKPNSRSIAGRRRVEFQNILDMGLDRLF